MEFMNTRLLSEEVPHDAKIPPFGELKESPRLDVTMDLKMVDELKNRERLDSLLTKKYAAVSIRKLAPKANYADRIDFPRRVLLEMTSICNVLCHMCPRNHLLRPAMHMDIETYTKALKELSQHGVEGVWLYHLGEPLIHPGFRKILRYMESLDNLGFVWLSTNGHLFNQSNLDFIFDSRVDFLNFSLHAVSEESYRKVVPQGDFHRVLENYNRMAERKRGHLREKPFIHVQMIEQQATRHETGGFLESHIGEVEIVSINMLEYVNLPNNEFGRAHRQRKALGHCYRIQQGRCVICSNGAVTVCDAAYNCDTNTVGELYLGNIHEQSIHEIWNNDRNKRLQCLEKEGRLDEIAFCRNCTDYDF